MKNVVLYAVENGERRPLLSRGGDETANGVHIAARMADEIRQCSARGVTAPEFVITSEEREADEGGATIVLSEFQELDASLKPVGKMFNRIDALFAARAEAKKTKVIVSKEDADAAAKKAETRARSR